MASVQHKSSDKNRKQNTRNNPMVGVPREPSDISTFDKLILYLTKTNPEYSVSDFTEALYAYRRERQTLAGISLSQLEDSILSIVRNKYHQEKNDIDKFESENITDDPSELSVAAALWHTFKRYREREKQSKNAQNDETSESTAVEDQCLICFESLNSNKTETFPCNHTFHRNCLEEWFKIERTCPLCRKLSLFNDEFPTLT